MTFKEIASQIQEASAKRKALAEKLKHKLQFFPVNEANLSGKKITGVDGGFLKKQLYGASFIIRRASAVTFYYGETLKTSYSPAKIPNPEIIAINESLDELEFNTYASLLRVEKEISTALESIKTNKPYALLLDGSIVLHPSSTTKTNSFAYKKYTEVIELFKQLYSFCIENNILLIGVIEDSRSKKLSSLFLEKNECIFSDSLLLSRIMKKNQQTKYFPYSAEPITPILKDLGHFSKNLYSFYFRASDYDLPLRIDFLSNNPEQDSKTISELLLPLSNKFKEYSYPVVLIEADARAKLSERDISFVIKILKENLGNLPDLSELRREKRII